MSTAALFLLSLLHYVHGQTSQPSLQGNETKHHCINELKAISEPTHLTLSNADGIPPNYSSISSVAYHYNTSTLLFAGDFFYIDPKDTKKRTYYQYFQAFTHTNNKFEIKYSKNISFTNPSFGNQLITHESLRSWTRIIAHPSLPYIFLLGVNNLTAFNVTDGSQIWTAQIKPCAENPKKTNNPDRPVIYNDATFFKGDIDHILVGGTCVSQWNKTVIVLDEYDVKTGVVSSTWKRLQYNLTEVGFFELENHPKIADILDGAGLVPPEITIKAPVGKTINTTIEDKYFYVGFTHLMFSGLARMEYDKISDDWRVKKWADHWTLVNPSFVVHRNLVATNDGLISLLDPSINGLLSLFLGHMKHLIGWETKKELGQLDEHEIFNKSTWYAGHEKYDLHLDWTLSIDPLSNYENIYVTTAPLELQLPGAFVKNSTIAKHHVAFGDLIGGAQVPFYAIDSIVTNDGQLVTVGFEWTPSMNEELPKNFSLSGYLPYLERKAVFQVFNNTETEGSCVGCKIDYYSNTSLGDDGLCINECNCENGYCNDDLKGDGSCYCTIMSFGKTCKACDGTRNIPDSKMRSCDPLRGICDSGPTGSGTCKFCYSIDLEHLIPPNISIGIGDEYGPECDYPCTCETENGICYTTGDIDAPHAGECLFCSDSNFWGPNCDKACDCDTEKGYCDNGVHGTGCIAFDYGGLLKNKGWQFYTAIGSCLFIFFFTITFWSSNKHYKEHNNGESLPWCPKREKKENVDKDRKKDNDLNERMLNANNNGNGHHVQQNDNYLLDEDSNEPPAISHHMVNDGNGVIIEQEQNDQPDKFDM